MDTRTFKGDDVRLLKDLDRNDTRRNDKLVDVLERIADELKRMNDIKEETDHDRN